ncbi:hypothetical protein D9757_000347 [Collybiopsis confluens]|uniref:Telomerase Cajal body protein 1 n=1 Tax=Collybiopsis confluens TaxID=2823264 RepID=A0A8H5I291_9AGAR|nr:hypothetical protein D9757_000347 [Collybiopsis confluens]
MEDWTPPQFDTSRPPTLENTLNLAEDVHYPQNFARIAKWCPDGSAFLSQCENRSFQLQPFDTSSFMSIEPIRTFPQPAPIVDFTWYPTASAQNLATFCFVASVRECPVKLLDASDGRLRASYPIVDHRERFIAPQSLAFNLSAQKLYCGFEDAIEVFDVATPGEGIRLSTTPSKKSKDGLKGIISALAFCPSYDSDVFAAGSLNTNRSNIGLFSESQGQFPMMFCGGGMNSAVMQLQFNPMQPHFLYASYRRDKRIFCWDIRTNVDQPFKIFSPTISGEDIGGEGLLQESSNQKHRFDIDVGGKWLAVGRQDGVVHMYDISEAQDPDATDENQEPTVTSSSLVFPAHDADSSRRLNWGCYFSSIVAQLLSTSGSRVFDSASDSESESEEEDDTSVEYRKKRYPRARDSSLKLWKF